MFSCITVSTFKEDQVDAVLEAAKICAAEMGKLKGNVSYDILKAEDPATIIFAEIWETKEDFLAHLESKGFGDFAGVMVPASAAPPTMYNSEVAAHIG